MYHDEDATVIDHFPAGVPALATVNDVAHAGARARRGRNLLRTYLPCSSWHENTLWFIHKFCPNEQNFWMLQTDSDDRLWFLWWTRLPTLLKTIGRMQPLVGYPPSKWLLRNFPCSSKPATLDTTVNPHLHTRCIFRQCPRLVVDRVPLLSNIPPHPASIQFLTKT